MTVAGFRSSNHPLQVAKRGGAVDSVDDRATPDDFFGALHSRYGFTVDVAAAAHNAKLPRFYNRVQDGLAQSWAGERVWCNPPYSEIRPWVEKAWSEDAELVVMLLPSTRTEQAWWQDLVEPYRDRPGSPLAAEFLPGRLRFAAPEPIDGPGGCRPLFGSVLLTWSHVRPPLQGIQARLAV